MKDNDYVIGIDRATGKDTMLSSMPSGLFQGSALTASEQAKLDTEYMREALAKVFSPFYFEGELDSNGNHRRYTKRK